MTCARSENSGSCRADDLDLGERAAIALAETVAADLLLIVKSVFAPWLEP